jgi:nucleotide-binding universal stress UspA family protein
MTKNNVLIPLNQSEYSQKILPHIEKFISTEENDLILFYVTKPPSGTGFGAPDPGSGYELKPGGEPVGPKPHPIYAHQQEDSIKADVEADLLPVTNHLKELGYTVSVVIGFGDDPVAEIIQAVAKHKIELVAMSTRARVGVTRFFFRDIADTIAQKINTPVLLIHPHKDDRSTA